MARNGSETQRIETQRIRDSEYSQVSATSWFSDLDQESLSMHY